MPDLHPEPLTVTPAAISSAEPREREQARGTDALAHLAKMSGTGSTFGAADYVAINPIAVASLIVGFSGALALLVSLFIFLPVVGFACGLLGIRQIRRSNGTQGGLGFAVAGILVSLAMGGVIGAREVGDWLRVRNETQEAAALIARFGDEVHAGNYDNVYDGLTTEAFRDRVDRATFRRTLEDLQHIPGYGPIQSIEWNHEGMLIENLPDSETRITFMMLIKCRDLQEPGHEYVRVSNKDGRWKISSIPHLFAEKKGPKGFPG